MRNIMSRNVTKQRKGVPRAAAGAIILLFLSAGCAERDRETPPAATTGGTASPEGTEATSEVEVPAVVKTPAIQSAAAMQDAFAQVARSAEPAVVTITTERRLPVSPPGGGPYFGPGPGNPSPFGGPLSPFEEFFRRFREFGPSSWTAPERDGERSAPFYRTQGGAVGGIGSGLIYAKDGLILTNAHVVRDAARVTVKLADGRTFDNARVLGEDARTDVAVIKINAGDLPTVPLGDSSKVRVGDWAIAVGNPFGLEKTLTVGVISATAREVPLSEAGPGDYLQTDASINPGNSGGPLLDIYGRVIGINNAIYSRTGGNVGIGFAIPANTAREIADILVNEGRVRRALLGVSVTDLDASRARAFGLDNALRGALIESVAPDSPASRAGLQPGDVVTSINGEPVTDAGDLQTRVSRSAIGSEVRLTVRRGGKDLNLTARLAELTAGSPARPDHRAAPAPPDTPAGLGIALAPLNAETARRFQIGVGARGVVIAAVAAGSPAAQVGLRPGDVIERVGQTPVATPQQVQTEVQRIARSQTGTRPMIALYIHRGGEKRYAMVPFRE